MSQERDTVEAMVQIGRGYRRLGEMSVPKDILPALQTHYEQSFLPKLKANISGGDLEYDSFAPRSQAGIFLQHEFLVKPKSVKGSVSESSGRDFDALLDYKTYHDRHHGELKKFFETFGYYDLFLIDFDTGDIVYSVAKEIDFGTNLLSGPHRNSGLAEVARKVMKNPVRGQSYIVDFEPYAPSYNAPAAFIAAPIYNGPHVIGILAYQLPINKIQGIMTSNARWREEGMGETGESYIVGSDYLMRSDSRFLLEGKEAYFEKIRAMGLNDDVIELIDKLNTTILLQPVRTVGARAALMNESGHLVAEDYRGVRVLTTYGKLDIKGLEWGLVTEIDEAEAFSPIGRLLRRILISTAIFIPIVAYLSFWLSQFFMRPVQALTETAMQLREKYDSGDHEAADKINFESNHASEYQDLSQQLNHVLEHARKDMADARRRENEYTDLITSALPSTVAERFRSGDKHIFDEAKMATALFVQIENFNSIINRDDVKQTSSIQFALDRAASELAEALGIDVFHQMGMELIAICGLTTPYINHAERILKFAQQLLTEVETFNTQNNVQLSLNMGLAIGPMMGALQTGKVLDYDVLSDAVYTCREAGYLGPTNGLSLTKTAKDYISKSEITLRAKKIKETIQTDDGIEDVFWVSGADFVGQSLT